MIEGEWLACSDPLGLLRAIPSPPRRKRELFACACCRHLWAKLTDPRTRRAVEIAEQFIDGAASRDELLDACGPARAVSYGYSQVNKARGYRVADFVASAVARCCLSIADNSRDVVEHAAHLASQSDDIPAEWQHQSALVRDIFSNPFHSVAFRPAWRTDTAVALTRRMYELRDFGAMPILADALQDAGCEREEILNHCRGDGPHVRGCWVVDLVLGKE
jgi:hypothetical protein